MKKILITGGSGLLAVNWAQSMSVSADVHILLNKRNIVMQGVTSHFGDLTSEEGALSTLRSIDPDLIINTIALTDVDLAERKIEIALQCNFLTCCYLASAASKYKIPIVQISTDQVFDGSKEMYRELDKCNPLNFYGLTKHLAEQAVLKICTDSLVIRTNFFGWGPPYRRSFSDCIIDKVGSGQVFETYSDVFFTPVYVSAVVRVVHQLLDLEQSGLFHLSCNTPISKYQFAVDLCTQMELDSRLVKPICFSQKLSKSKETAARPKNMSLSNSKVLDVLQGSSFDLGGMVAEMLADLEVRESLSKIISL
jgi:dTDP-4-dehydrorhamnose reductase